MAQTRRFGGRPGRLVPYPTSLLIPLAVLVVVGTGSPTRAAPGDLLETLKNPNPSGHAQFGLKVVPFGERVIVTCPGEEYDGASRGAVYLVNPANGTILQRYQRPEPVTAAAFGTSATTVGSLVAIGDSGWKGSLGEHVGAVHIYDSTDGSFLRTIESPHPAVYDYFGHAVASLEGRVAVSSLGERTDRPRVYVFSVESGELLHEIEPPADYDDFGRSLATHGETIAIGASDWDGPGGSLSNVGVVFLADATTGEVFRTIENPSPVEWEWFGSSLDVVGGSLLVGSLQAGEAYLFDLDDGSLLRTYPNPGEEDPAFGSVVAASTDKILVAAPLGPVYLIDPHSGEVELTYDVPDVRDLRNSPYSRSISLALLDQRMILGNPGARYYHDFGGVSRASGQVYVFEALTEPGPPFRRGDADADGVWNIGDAVYLARALFVTGEPVPCEEAGDGNDDGEVDIADVLFLCRYLFLGHRPPPDPFEECAPDPTLDRLTCESYPGCPR